jgi:hypothetical protein
MQDPMIEAVQWAKSLDRKGYPKTAAEIMSLVESFGAEKETSDFKERALQLFDVFKEEFVETLPTGKDYRRRCFDEILMIVLQAFVRLEDEFRKSSKDLDRFLTRMREMDDSIMPMSELFGNLAHKPDRSHKDDTAMFHVASYIYMIGVEGIFDELAKILYYFMTASKEHVPKSQELEEMDVWNILKACRQIYGITPVFLENWEEKRHLRNAIGHARAQYHPTRSEVHFEDVDTRTKQVYHKTMGIDKFLDINVEIIDTVDSFRYIISLVYILELLVAAYTQHGSTT